MHPLAREIRTSVSKSLGFASNLYQVEGEVNAFVYYYYSRYHRGDEPSGRVIRAMIVGRRGNAVAALKETNTPAAGLPLVVRRSTRAQEKRMIKGEVYLFGWDVLGGVEEHGYGGELVIPITCSDEELVAFVRTHNGDEEDPDEPWGVDWRGQPNTYGWRCTCVVRGENTAMIEWRSDRNHLAATTIIWV